MSSAPWWDPFPSTATTRVGETAGMRAFVALPLPESLRRSLDAYAEARRDADRITARSAGTGVDWSWTMPEQWHVTLAFADHLPVDRLEQWDDLLGEVAARTVGFRLRLDGAGTFPHPDAAKVLHLRVVDDSGGTDRVAALARAVRTAARRAGVETDRKRFVPHLTLARSRRGVSATRWIRAFEALELPDWPVTGMQLVESQWSGPGRRAVHRVESDHRFGSEV